MRLTPAEWQLMNALWQGHPASAREIMDRLPPRTAWAYTTVKTMLTRLVAKGALRETERDGNAALYAPVLTRTGARVVALASLAKDAFDGAFGSVMHFLVEHEKLSAKERQKLIVLLKGRAKKGTQDDHGT